MRKHGPCQALFCRTCGHSPSRVACVDAGRKKAMGHPVRVRILRMLSRREARVCSEIVNELPLAQSTVSEHLRILKGAGLVRASCNGTKVGYCIEAANLRRMKALVAIL